VTRVTVPLRVVHVMLSLGGSRLRYLQGSRYISVPSTYQSAIGLTGCDRYVRVFVHSLL